jgi:hypothetical protein
MNSLKKVNVNIEVDIDNIIDKLVSLKHQKPGK